MELLKKVTVQINKGTDRPIIAKQNDTARYLLFNIIEDNGVPFSLRGKEVKIFAVKPDSKLIYNTCSMIDSNKGQVKVNLTSQILAVSGTVDAELVISEGNNILSTIPFEIEVIKSLRNDSAIESTSEFTVLFSKIKEGQTLEASISELIKVGTPLYNKLKPVVDDGKPLSTDLPPKVNEAKAIYQQLLQVIQNGDLGSYAKKKYLDTRNTNENPEWYFENYPNQTITELKLLSSIGVSGSNFFGILTTKVPWNNNSGGYPVQTFVSYSLMAIYKRHGTSNTEWSAWAMVYTSDSKPTPDEIGAASIRSGVGDVLKFHTYGDLNSLDKTCFGYSGSSTLGKPTGQDHAIMQMTYDNDLWKTQLAHDWRTNRLYVRAKNNGNWYNWAELYSTLKKPTPEELGAAKAPSKERLWTGGYVFTSGHKVRLSKNIKDTPQGLRLIWSAYTGGVIRDYNYREELVFKDESMFGKSQVLLLADTGGNFVTKTVYVTDNGMSLVGHDDNGNGNNGGMVLREILEF